MTEIRIKSQLKALLTSKVAKACLIVVAILVPLAWVLYSARQSATSELMSTLFTVGLAAPGAGIATAIFGLARYVLRGRKVRLRIGERVRIPRSGIDFRVEDLGVVQLFTYRSRAFMALIPAHISEQLSAASLGDGSHSLGPYVVEFPVGSNMKTFEVAEKLQETYPSVKVEKIGAVAAMQEIW
ncbi:hypothetical protein [Corynebacterium epidermidicanis]|uniref:DUF304 domain-containing protein n=1 Tax=Corynebacterium epidermidicanis TaxID=1050174 RepID=A0A0G3GSZ4_9CORY|nr:hypothetical protein [Corynebacterium epidermidicanis]AKK03655.1 hypothetical protein CEPID_09045 [Corynebacterium epidermidicanis]